MKAKPSAANRPVQRSPKSRAAPGKPPRRARDSSGRELGKRRDESKVAKRLPIYDESDARADREAPPPPAAHCTACGLCCSYVAIEVDKPSTVKRATQLLWYIYHEGVSLYMNEDEWMVQFETTCQYLQPDYRCGIYATRPHICREFSEKDCEVNTGDDGLTFYTAGEFLAHLQQSRPRVHTLIKKNFAPPEAAARRQPSAFEKRFSAVRARRAALGV